MDVKQIVKVLAVAFSGALMTTWAYLMGSAEKAEKQKDILTPDDSFEDDGEELSADTQ